MAEAVVKMHRGLWLPGCGKKSFFPLCPCRTVGPTRPENSARLPPSRHTACAPSGIIHTRSLHYESGSQDFSSFRRGRAGIGITWDQDCARSTGQFNWIFSETHVPRLGCGIRHTALFFLLGLRASQVTIEA